MNYLLFFLFDYKKDSYVWMVKERFSEEVGKEIFGVNGRSYDDLMWRRY